MTAVAGTDVLDVLDLLSMSGVVAWLDGGWGVDALLGEQSRPHADLDLVLDGRQLAAAQRVLGSAGFVLIDDELPARCVLVDSRQRKIDLHPVEFDAEGGGVQALQDGRTWRYPPEGFAGQGRVGGRTVRCLTAEVQLLCHEGYEPDADDRADVAHLCERFRLAPPRGY